MGKKRSFAAKPKAKRSKKREVLRRYLKRLLAYAWTPEALREAACVVCKHEMVVETVCMIVEIVTGTDPEMGGSYYIKEHTHLACAIEHMPDELRTTIEAMEVDSLEDVLPYVRDALPSELLSVAAQRVPKRSTATLHDDSRTVELMAELERDPSDRALLAVLADHLMQLGDDRGELIHLQLADAKTPRVAELCERLGFKLGMVDRTVWGIGFLREILVVLGGAPFEERAKKLTNPSCRLLHRLSVWQNRPSSPEVVLSEHVIPHALRVVDVIGGLATGDLSWLPHLDTVIVDRCHDLSHPTLPNVELRATDRETIEACARGVPGLERLVIERVQFGNVPPTNLDELLGGLGLVARIRELELKGIRCEDELRERCKRANVRVVETPMRTS